MIDEHNTIKIIDFGFSITMPKDKKLSIFCGTPSYMATEIVKKQDYCGQPVDVWALGILLFTMLSGRFPFKGMTAHRVHLGRCVIYLGLYDKDLFQKIIECKYKLPAHISATGQALISEILEPIPSKRPTAEQVKSNFKVGPF